MHWLGALRRFVVLVVGISMVTAAVSLGLGTLGGASASRSVSLGFYLVGAFALIAGFFVGNRGPARPTQEFHLFGPRFMRWATKEETEEAVNLSAVFVAVGVVLILIGLLADTRVKLV